MCLSVHDACLHTEGQSTFGPYGALYTAFGPSQDLSTTVQPVSHPDVDYGGSMVASALSLWFIVIMVTVSIAHGRKHRRA